VVRSNAPSPAVLLDLAGTIRDLADRVESFVK